MKSILFLGVCLVILVGCANQRNALEADVQLITQSADLQQLTYTIEVIGSGQCDTLGAEVEVRVPLSLGSTISPGENVFFTHDIGRIERGGSISEVFTVQTEGAKVETTSLRAEVIDVDDYHNCNPFTI